LRNRDQLIIGYLAYYEERKAKYEKIENLQMQINGLKRENMELWERIKEKEDLSNKSSHGKSVKSLESKVKTAYDANELRRHIFQSLIFESGVNWAENEELREIVLSLGTIIPEDD